MAFRIRSPFRSDQVLGAPRARRSEMAPRGLFEDGDFPARWDSLSNPGDAVAWRRPCELREKPQLFVDGSSRFDINQGRLGDCWFLAACAAVAERPELMKKVIPEGQVLYGPGYDGSVRFRFWNLGSWDEVRIDDRLPVDANGKPVYAHCKDKDEFWMPLLEKAFARQYGQYVSIEGGWVCEGLTKLTGFSLETLKFSNWTTEENFQKMKDGLENGGLIVIGTDSSGPGVPGGHAYTVNKTFYQPKTEKSGKELRLVRVRNPWGTHVEWTGAWRDGDECWNNLSNKTREELEYKSGEDGEFWMDIKDFSDTFSDGVMSSEVPQKCGPKDTVQEIIGSWNDDKCGGPPDDIESFATNPQYLLMVEDEENSADNMIQEHDKDKSGEAIDKVEVLVELVQDTDRKTGDYEFVGIYIFEAALPASRALRLDPLLD